MAKTIPYDPAEFLESEESIAAYLAQVVDDGGNLERAEEVARRARELNGAKAREQMTKDAEKHGLGY